MADELEDDGALEERVAAMEAALERIELAPGPLGELARGAVADLASLYGAALARVVRLVSGHERLVRALAADPLVGHLMVLHELPGADPGLCGDLDLDLDLGLAPRLPGGPGASSGPAGPPTTFIPLASLHRRDRAGRAVEVRSQ